MLTSVELAKRPSLRTSSNAQLHPSSKRKPKSRQNKTATDGGMIVSKGLYMPKPLLIEESVHESSRDALP